MSLEGPFVSTALLLIVGVASSKTRTNQAAQALPSEKDEDPAGAVSAPDAPAAPVAD